MFYVSGPSSLNLEQDLVRIFTDEFFSRKISHFLDVRYLTKFKCKTSAAGTTEKKVLEECD
jgi:hypothetical protein